MKQVIFIYNISKGIDTMKRYEERNGKTLEIEVRYNVGGQNNWTSRNEKRGYYLHVTPVQIKDYGTYRTVTMTAFSGYKQLLKEVGRKSAKAEQEAIQIAEQYVEEMIKAVQIQLA
jgi:DNA mismatch repair ATPase MutS